jgi:hypothetical protein
MNSRFLKAYWLAKYQLQDIVVGSKKLVGLQDRQAGKAGGLTMQIRQEG